MAIQGLVVSRANSPNARELWCGNTGANTTLLVEKLIEHGILVSPLEATLLALGIYEDTETLPTHLPPIAMLQPWPGCSSRSVA